MAIMVTLSFLVVGMFFFGFFEDPIQIKLHPRIQMNRAAGRNSAVIALWRFRKVFRFFKSAP